MINDATILMMVNSFCADELKRKPGLFARSFGLGRGSAYYAGRQDMAELISNLISDSQRSETQTAANG